MKFVPFALLFIFSATFFSLWIMDRPRQYLLWFSLSFLAFASAALSQLLIPLGSGINTIASAALYTSGALLFGKGVLSRSGKRLGQLFKLSALTVIVGLVGYFFYIDPNLLARIYVLNLGLACIFLFTGWIARFLLRGSRIDQALFAAVLLIGLHFIPRTLLTANSVQLGSTVELGDSLFWFWVQFSLIILGVAAGLCLLLIAGADVITRLGRERNTDALTGVLNRRGFEAAITSNLRNQRDTERSWALLCDVDHFKSINDQFGHAAGDIVLSDIARVIRRTVRGRDAVARLGGEEFVIVMTGCSASEAYAMAERLRADIEALRYEVLPPERFVACSFGIAEFEPGEGLWSVIQRADESLYIAKRTGRNRTVAKGFALES